MNKIIVKHELKNHYLAEIPFNSVEPGQRYLIGDIPQLRNVKITAIEIQDSGSILVSPSGRQNINNADIHYLSLSLTLKKQSENKQEAILNLPFTSLNRVFFNNGIITETDNIQVDLSKSYVTIHGGVGVVPGNCCLISFWYEG
jgi:hypothetical protein